MKFPFHPWRRLLLCALPFAALLTACDDGEERAPAQTARSHHLQQRALGRPLPATSDADLLAGVNAWRSACARLARTRYGASPVRARTTAAADPTAVRVPPEADAGL
ncbi:hypothetical protein ACPA9J_14380 [Pseudomonas aeruginosa]